MFLKKEREITQEVFGTTNPISKEDYQHIYNNTGLDVDGRKFLLKEILEDIAWAMQSFAEFATAIPGFRKLPLADQVTIIEGISSH